MQRSKLVLAVALAAAAAAPAAVHADKPAAAPARPEPSGPLRAAPGLQGPEGELVVMVEVNDGKEMLVHFKNLGKDLDGKTVLYLLEDQGKGTKNVYVNKQRGSKTYRSVLLSARDGAWEFHHPTNPKIEFAISYSEQASLKFRLEDVLNGYKP
jgi:hypothetical protein